MKQTWLVAALYQARPVGVAEACKGKREQVSPRGAWWLAIDLDEPLTLLSW